MEDWKDFEGQEEVYRIQSALQAVRKKIDVEARYVFIEYEFGYNSKQTTKAPMTTGKGDYIGEVVYRLGTTFSDFSHAKLLVLEDTDGVLRGCSWDITEENKRVTLKHGGGQEWTFNNRSGIHMIGITVRDNASITNLAKGIVQSNTGYNLLTNNCEIFCTKLSSQICVKIPTHSGRTADEVPGAIGRLINSLGQIPVVKTFIDKNNLGYTNRTSNAMFGASRMLVYVGVIVAQWSLDGTINVDAFERVRLGD